LPVATCLDFCESSYPRWQELHLESEKHVGRRLHARCGVWYCHRQVWWMWKGVFFIFKASKELVSRVVEGAVQSSLCNKSSNVRFVSFLPPHTAMTCPIRYIIGGCSSAVINVAPPWQQKLLVSQSACACCSRSSAGFRWHVCQTFAFVDE
jgi:hypothetical protein